MTLREPSPRIAYLSMEIGLDASMPTYSGGLGVLAGDTLKAGADLGVPMVAVTLLYRGGYFRQHLDEEGHQTETTYPWDPSQHLKPLDIAITVLIEGRTVAVRPWLYTIHGVGGNTVPVYMLDTDLPENAPEDRALTGQLYGGDQRYRLCQEVVLGLGGLLMLKALGYDGIETYHMNEGHSTLLTLGLLAQISGSPGLTDINERHIAAVRRKCIMTTHTPVSAGHDRFQPGLVEQVLGLEWLQAIMRQPFFAGERLNMTYLGLFFSRYVNAVARLHGETAKMMYPGYDINAITNGVHAGTWASPAIAALFDRYVPLWRQDTHYLRQALDIPLEEIRNAHTAAKSELFDEIERRRGVRFNPQSLTIGFARRAASYKRADLVFSDLGRLEALARDMGPIQFVFAGKAHPADEGAKALIQNVVNAGDHLRGKIPVVYLEEHDMALGKLLCSGVDLWLNNPRRPMEASGTSGMKAALNGVPSLSVLDGWWPEGWMEGITGWAIAEHSQGSDDGSTEASSIYEKLRNAIMPLYYGSPVGYARVMRSAIAVNGSYFTAQRMLQQYVQDAYTQRD